ncbi:WD40 repeat domain-containing protein [Endozoicomonas sp. ALD040]|uniref:WD40 repeat domain-containing protein n=1 Tax=Endozoicomonas sp. ALD040 TaxID=3403079 RepID=UPI003BB0DA66
MNIVKNLAVASLIILPAVSCLQAQAQTSGSIQPTEIPPQLFYEFEVDPNQLPEIPTAPAPTHCPPHRALSISWNKNSTLIAVGIGSGDNDDDTRKCRLSGALQIFNVSASGYPRLVRTHHATNWIESVTFSPDGTQLIAGGKDGKVKIYGGISPFSYQDTLSEALRDLRTVAINPNGTLLAAGGYNTKIMLYLKNETNQFTYVKTLSQASRLSSVVDLDFNPINSQLAAAQRHRIVRTYRGTSPYNLLKTLFDSCCQMLAVAYNPNGTLLTSGDMVGQVRFYNGMNPNNTLHTLSVSGQVSSLAYNPSGTRLVVGQGNGKVSVFEGIIPFSHLHTLPSGRSPTVVYSRDGKWLVTGGDDGKIMIYRVDGLRAPTTEAVTKTRIKVSIENGTEVHSSSTFTALSLVTLLTTVLQGMILQ